MELVPRGGHSRDPQRGQVGPSATPPWPTAAIAALRPRQGSQTLAGGRAKRTPPVARPPPRPAPREGCVNALPMGSARAVNQPRGPWPSNVVRCPAGRSFSNRHPAAAHTEVRPPRLGRRRVPAEWQPTGCESLHSNGGFPVLERSTRTWTRHPTVAVLRTACRAPAQDSSTRLRRHVWKPTAAKANVIRLTVAGSGTEEALTRIVMLSCPPPMVEV